MKAGDVVGWKVEPAGVVVLTLSGGPLPYAYIGVDEDGEETGAVRYSSDPLLFFAMVASQPTDFPIGHG